MRTIYIMAGGPENLLPDLEKYNKPSIWVGVDKGVSSLLALGIEPEVAFGDFDSIDAKDRHFTAEETYTFKAEKDDTDLGLALRWAIEQKPDSISIFGATGGRMDHTVGAIHLLVEENVCKSSIFIAIIDRQNKIEAKLPGCHTVECDRHYKYISFFAMSPAVTGLTLEGFKYPLRDTDLKLGTSLCISNELISDIGTYSFTSGILMMIRSND